MRKLSIKVDIIKRLLFILCIIMGIGLLIFVSILNGIEKSQMIYYRWFEYRKLQIDLHQIQFQTMEEVDFKNVPVETLNPNSQFFRMIYKDTYGLPSKYNKANHENFLKEFSKDLPPWQNFMPNTATSLNQYKLHNPSGYSSAFTSAQSSSVLMPNQKQFNVGDIFTAQIQARDFLKRNKVFGGDYFRARLMRIPSSGDKLEDGIPCFVEDHLNGSYTLRVPLLVPGTYKLDVILCASIEAIDGYVRWADGRTHLGIVFEATLISNETTACNSDLLMYDKYQSKRVCNYSNPRNQEPFFCSVPPSGICFPIKFISPFPINKIFKDSFNSKKPFDLNKKLEEIYHSYGNVFGSGSFIEVLPQQALLLNVRNPYYKRINGIISSPNGFFFKNRWVSFTHEYEFKDLKNFVRCFSNKVVYLLGDSTMRQFFDLMANPLDLKVYVNDSSKYYHVPRIGRNEKHNISVYYRAHGLPIRNPGPPSVAPYISDTISTIEQGGSNVVMFINIGLHYVEYNPFIYIHRLNGIKRALMDHSKKYPDTKIIIKGMNVSNLKLLPYEWLIYRQNSILREFFKELNNSVFIDLWDMTTLWPLTVDYHPNINILIQQANIMFNYVCD